MINQIYLLLICFNIGCSGQSDNSNPETLVIPQKVMEIPIGTEKNESKNIIHNLEQLRIIEESKNYKTVKQEILTERNQLGSLELDMDSIGTIFKRSLLNKIIPFWEGTEWSFEGHTSKPKLGKIACGYFVSTTLQDIGLNLNRYRLAQQSPINEAKSLAISTEIKEYNESTELKNISAIKEELKDGIHFIGFDQSHVGYNLKQNEDLYLIHSNYINAEGVEIERINESEVFKSYSKYYIVELSTNEDLLNHWKNNKRIEIIK